MYDKSQKQLVNEFPSVDTAMVLDILQNCKGDVLTARSQIQMLFGVAGDEQVGTQSNDLKADSWNEIPEISSLSKNLEESQNQLRYQQENFRDQTAEHINSYLTRTSKDRTLENYAISEKDPPLSNKKARKKNRKRRKKKKVFRAKSDSEEELVFQNRKDQDMFYRNRNGREEERREESFQKEEAYSDETRESVSNFYEESPSDFSSLNFSRILDDIEGPEITKVEKEEILQVMKRDYQDSWDEYDQKSFMDIYLEGQMIEDMVPTFLPKGFIGQPILLILF